MKKKKLITILIGLLALIIVITGAIVIVKKMKGNTETPNEGNNNVVVTPNVTTIEINDQYSVSEGMKSALEQTRLNEYMDGENPKERNEADILINFNDLSGATAEQFGDITEDSITAVYLVKLGNSNQYNEVYKRIQDKLRELKNKYKDNKAISTILSYDENVVVRQVQGVVIGTFAPDAGALNFGLEQTINEQNQRAEEQKRGQEERRAEAQTTSEEE